MRLESEDFQGSIMKTALHLCPQVALSGLSGLEKKRTHQVRRETVVEDRRVGLEWQK